MEDRTEEMENNEKPEIIVLVEFNQDSVKALMANILLDLMKYSSAHECPVEKDWIIELSYKLKQYPELFKQIPDAYLDVFNNRNLFVSREKLMEWEKAHKYQK